MFTEGKGKIQNQCSPGNVVTNTCDHVSLISSLIKTSFYQLRLISKFKSYLPPDQLERLIHVFITSRLDN